MPETKKWNIGPEADLALALSRLAHWMLDDPGFTKRQAALELAEIARKLSPEMARQVLGNAAALERDDAGRLRHIAENTGILSFLYDMLGEVYCKTNEAGEITAIREGLKKPESDSLDAIRYLIDQDIEDKRLGRNAFAVSGGSQ